ncbi:MAG: DUF2085 domain-containing protein [Caldilineaceae bacterium]|nr:DUF2085 domain-containing protein [Caldilineaceae bacterium]
MTSPNARPPAPSSIQPPTQPPTPPSALADAANRLVLWIARHWLALFNTAWALYVILPFIAPILMQAGYMTPARAIYGLYSFTCHQLPDHSYFLFGESPVPQAEALMAAGAPDASNLFLFRSFIGNPQIGYKVALCERDIAIYGSVALGGLVFALLRRRGKVRAPSLKVYALFLIPIAVDGLSQLVGLRESNWWLRTVTGALFGLASVWLAYPYVEDAMQEVIETESRPNSATAP